MWSSTTSRSTTWSSAGRGTTTRTAGSSSSRTSRREANRGGARGGPPLRDAPSTPRDLRQAPQAGGEGPPDTARGGEGGGLGVLALRGQQKTDDARPSP